LRERIHLDRAKSRLSISRKATFIDLFTARCFNAMKKKLTNGHPWADRDGQLPDVGEFERQTSVKAGMHSRCSCYD
jgi:hypothetical protein